MVVLGLENTSIKHTDFWIDIKQLIKYPETFLYNQYNKFSSGSTTQKKTVVKFIFQNHDNVFKLQIKILQNSSCDSIDQG